MLDTSESLLHDTRKGQRLPDLSGQTMGLFTSQMDWTGQPHEFLDLAWTENFVYAHLSMRVTHLSKNMAHGHLLRVVASLKLASLGDSCRNLMSSLYIS